MFLEFGLRTQAALFHAGRSAILLAGVEHIAEGLRILREDKKDGFFTLVFVAIDRYGLVDGAGGLQFQLQIIQKCHDTSRTSLPRFRIAGAAGGRQGGEKSVKKRRDKIEDADIMLSEDAEDEAYKLYKKRCYRYLIVKALLAFVLGCLFRFLLGKL